MVPDKLFLIAGLVVAAQAAATQTRAADLGGNCCADLEQRIAELRGFYQLSGGGIVVGVDTTSFALENNALRFIGANIANILTNALNGAVAAAPLAPPGQMNLGGAPADFGDAGTPLLKSGVWGSAFGARATFDSNDLTPADQHFGGGIAGGHFRFTPNVAVGAFAGGATNAFDTERGKSIDTEYVLGGVYARAIAGNVALDGALTAGHSDSHSERELVTNLPGVPTLQTALADYYGGFVAPNVRISAYVPMINGAVFVPAIEARYIWNRLDGYAERGSSVNLTIDDRTLQSFEERFEIGLQQSIAGFSWHVNAGIVLYQRVGDRDVGVSLFGTGVTFDPGGPHTEAGVFGRAGIDVEIAQGFAVFVDGEATRTSDSEAVSGSAGVKVDF